MIQVLNSQRDAAVLVGNDADDAFVNGIYDEALAIVSAQVTGYSSLSPGNRQIAKDAIKQQFAIFSRYFMPITSSMMNTTPSCSITSLTEIGTLSLKTYAARQVQFCVNMSASSTVANTGIEYYVSVGGIAIDPKLHFMITPANTHTLVSGTWIGIIPAGTSTIRIHAQRYYGTGTIILGADDFIAMTLVG